MAVSDGCSQNNAKTVFIVLLQEVSVKCVKCEVSIVYSIVLVSIRIPLTCSQQASFYTFSIRPQEHVGYTNVFYEPRFFRLKAFYIYLSNAELLLLKQTISYTLEVNHGSRHSSRVGGHQTDAGKI
jgi:hypothetical protein